MEKLLQGPVRMANMEQKKKKILAPIRCPSKSHAMETETARGM